MRLSADHRRPGLVLILAALAVTAALGTGACGSGSGERPTLPSDGPTADRTASRPPPDVAQTAQPPAQPTDRQTPTRDATPTERPDRTDPAQTQPPAQPPAQTQPPAQPPAQTQPPAQPPAQTQPPEPAVPPATQPAAPAAAASTPATTTAAESQALGDVGCLLLILMVGLLIGGLAIWRTHQKSGWDTEAATLVAGTDATVAQLPPVLATTTTAQRALTWPPLRAALVDLMDHWGALAQQESDDHRRMWCLQLRGLIQDLVLAEDAENEAMAFHDDWRLLRPRTAAAEQMLSSTLGARPLAGTPTGGQPGVAGVQP
jgi:hypothetical protein